MRNGQHAASRFGEISHPGLNAGARRESPDHGVANPLGVGEPRVCSNRPYSAMRCSGVSSAVVMSHTSGPGVTGVVTTSTVNSGVMSRVKVKL